MSDILKQYAEHGYPSLNKFKSIVGKKDLKPIRKQYAEIFERHKQKHETKKSQGKFYAVAPFIQLQADLIDMSKFAHSNHNNKWILVLVDIFTRYAFAEPLKTKSDAIDALKKMFEDQHLQDKPISVNPNIPKDENAIYFRILTTDQGNEFNNKQANAFYKTKHIIHQMVLVHDHRKLSIVDRFCKTIKTMIFKHFTANNTTTWIGTLPTFIEAYNNTPHPALWSIKPSDADKYLIRIFMINKIKALANKKTRKIQVGDHVRVKVRAPFKKGYTTQFSRDVYTVDAVNGNTVSVNGKEYKSSDVVVVRDYIQHRADDKMEEIEKKEKVKRRVRKEGIEQANDYTDKLRSHHRLRH